MIPAAFDYVRAESADDAIARLGEYGDDAKLLAGGMSLLPLMKLRLATPSVLIDVGRVRDLSYVREADGEIAIGALDAPPRPSRPTTCSPGTVAWCARSPRRSATTRCATAGRSADRSRTAIPASDLPAALLALDATFVVRGPGGERVIAAADFFEGFLETALAPDELLVRDPRAEDGGQRLRVREVQPAGAGLRDGGRRRRDASTARPVSVSSTWAPRRCGRRRSSRRSPAGASAADAAAHAAEGTEPTSDLNATIEYREHLARVLVRARARGALSSRCAAAVLAAGRGIRFGGDTPKPLLSYRSADRSCRTRWTPRAGAA